MHDHEVCEQLMAAASRNSPGRMEYLAWRCDRVHGDMHDETERNEHAIAAREAMSAPTESEAS